MARRNNVLGAPASNAGDEFHELWALREALRLLKPSTALSGVQLEGVCTESPSNSVGPQWDGVDCTLYFGELTIESAEHIEIVQLKYSVADPDKKWTLARICQKTAKSRNNSVARRLGDAFKAVKALRAPDGIESSLALKLVSNQPIHPDLLALRNQLSEGGKLTGPGEKLRKATGLDKEDFYLFVRCLSLMGGEDARHALRAAIIHTVASFTDESAKSLVAQLRQEIVNLMMPGGRNKVVDKPRILSWFGLADADSLFPCEAQIEHPKKKIQRETTSALVEAVIKSNLVCLHGGSGCGKTILLTSLSERLPDGSKLIIYDCYGAGRYNDPGAKRHRSRDAFTQLANEVSRTAGLPLYFSLKEETNHARAFRKRLEGAASALAAQSRDALLVIAIDAADNAIAAAQRTIPEEEYFIRDFVKFQDLPQNVRFVVSTRTSRKESLRLPRDTKDVECLPFTPTETAIFVQNQWPSAPQDWIEQFHHLSQGNPRVQHTAISGTKSLSEALDFLRPDGKSLEDVFRQLIVQAIKRSGEEVQIERVCAALSVLPTPAPLPYVAAASGTAIPFVTELCQDLIPSIRIWEDRVEFANEDFENFVREEGQKYRDDALHKAADHLIVNRLSNPYAATHLFSVLKAAGRGAELFDYLQKENGLQAIADPILKRQVEIQRHRIVVAFCASVGQMNKAIETILRAAEATKIGYEIESLLADAPDLAAAFAEENARRTILRSSNYRKAHGPLLMHLAARTAVLAERMPLAREYRRSATAWVQQRQQLEEHKEREWNLSDNDITAWADAIFLDAGPEGAVQYLREWKPPILRYAVGRLLLSRIAAREGTYGIAAATHAIPRNFQFMASIVSARAGKLPEKSVLEQQLNDLLKLKLSRIEPHREYGNSRSREAQLIDDILFFCDIAARVGAEKNKILSILADIWPAERRAYQKIYTGDHISIDYTLRAAALSARIKDEAFEYKTYFGIPENIDQDIKDETLRQRAKDLIEAITPIVGFYDAAVDLIFNGHSETGTESMNKMLERLNRDAYRFDRQLYGRPLRQCVARRFADLHAMGVINAEHALAGIKKAFAELDSFAALADESLQALSHDPDSHGGILGIAAESADRIQSYRGSASEKVEAYLRLARLILPVSRDDAKSFYQRAVDATREMDREAFDQIIFFSKTATVTRRQKRFKRRISIDLATFIEDAAIRLRGLDDFPWNNAFQALSTLDPNIALCALGRWTDTGICSLDEGLKQTLLTLLSCKDIGPVEAVACLFLLQDVDREIIREVISNFSVGNSSVSPSVIEELSRLTLQECTGLDLLTISQPIIDVEVNSADLPHLKELRELYVFLKNHEDEIERSSQSAPAQQAPRTDQNSKIHQFNLSGIDIKSAESIRMAIEECRKNGYGLESGLLAELRKQTSVSDRRAHLDALLELAATESYATYYIDAIIANLDEWGGSSPSVKDWAHENLPGLIKARLPRLIQFVWYHEEQLHDLLERTQLTPQATADLFLEGLEVNADSFNSRGLYQLAAELMLVADPQEATEVLEWYARRQAGAAQIRNQNEAVRPIEEAHVPNRIEESLAAFLYRFLGDVDVRLRWCAANAVRAIVRMGGVGFPALLLDLADTSEDFVFSAPNTPFHYLTAKVWLAILLARLADEAPGAISSLLQRIMALATDKDFPHVVFRHHLKRALEIILVKDPSSIKALNKQTIRTINMCSYSSETAETHHRHSMDHDDPRSSRRFHFDTMDTLPYWYDPALEIFSAVSANEFLDLAERWIVDKWGGSEETSHWDREPRRRRFYDSDYGLWSHRYGSYPTIERFWTYLEWHAMCCTVGELLLMKTCAPREDEYYGLTGWLRRWDITVPPVWLSDLRGTKPKELRYWQPLEQRGKKWLNEMDAQEFLEKLTIQTSSGKHFILASHESTRDYQYGDKNLSEEISVSCALVTGETASALVRALQIIDEPFDYGLPSSPREDLEIDQPGFRLLSCIDRLDSDDRLDRFDPQRRDIRLMAAEPGARLHKIKKMIRHVGRPITWVTKGTADAIFQMDAWSDAPTGYTDREQGRLNGQYCDGWRLSVQFERLLEYLQSLKMDLIIEVQIEREKGDRYGRSRKEETEETVFDKLFLLRRNGTIEDAHRFIQTWPDDCR